MRVRVILMTENDVPVERLGENPLEKLKGAWDVAIALISTLSPDNESVYVERVEIVDEPKDSEGGEGDEEGNQGNDDPGIRQDGGVVTG